MRRWLRLAALLAVLVAWIGSPRNAWADDTDARNARALELFEKSEVAYDNGRFADAIALLRQSYELKKEPVLLYNLGRAYEGIGDLAAAAQSYEAFLAAQPSAPDRGALERRIWTLRRQIDERNLLRKQALEREKEKPARSPSVVPWVVAGVGAAGVGVGGVLAILAKNQNEDAKSEPTYLEAERLHSKAESLATVANACFIAGGIVLVTGIIWGIVDASGSKKKSSGTLMSPGSFVF